MKLKTLATPLVLSLLLAACSDEPDRQPNTTNTNNTTNTTNTNNTNNTNNTTTPPTGSGADVDEIEPNDDYDTTTAFEVGQSIGGYIERGSGQNTDFDLYRVSLEGGTVFEWEFTHTGAGVSDSGMVAFLEDETGELFRVLAQANGSKRQAFIPTSGDYDLIVYDGIADQDTIPTHGGATATYVIETRSLALTATDAALDATIEGDLNEGQVNAYNLTAPQTTVLTAEIFAARAPGLSELDPVLYVWDTVAGEVVAFNDNINEDAQLYDAFLSAPMQANTRYQLIVDAIDNTSDAAYSVQLGQDDDDFSLPSALTLDTAATGSIDARAGERFDTDYFSISLAPGETVKVMASADAASPLQPTLYAYVDLGEGFEDLFEAIPVEGAAAFTLHHPASATEDADYIILIDDIRNIEGEEGDPIVGDDTHTYSILATASAIIADTATAPFELQTSLPLGEYLWFDFTIQPETFFALSATSPSGDPVIVGYDDEAGISGGTGTLMFRAAELDEQRFGVRDNTFKGEHLSSDYNVQINALTMSVAGVEFTPASQNPGNNSPADAQTITAPAVITGAASVAEEVAVKDHYKITLSAGETLLAYTSALAADDETDTIITVIGPDGTTVITNDDYNADDAFSATLIRATEAGDYLIIVEPYYMDFGLGVADGSGPYLLHVHTATTTRPAL